MSVQSGMISEPPVNVNDSDHSAVTWLSIFFYSLSAGARVARFRRGKRKQQKRQELRQADAGVLPGGGRCSEAVWKRAVSSPWALFVQQNKTPTLKGQKASVLNEKQTFPKAAFPIRSNFLKFIFNLFFFNSNKDFQVFHSSGIYSA